MPLSAGSRLGPYEILSVAGAGGMGEVYKARDTRLDRSVAIKVLPSELAAEPQFRERFDREARAISQLTHPNICTLYDVGNQDGTAYLVMELLDGQTLATRLAKGAIPADEALAIAIQIGEALAAAHRAGLVHRDLKPGNVMLTKTGAKLLDFGLAKPSGVTLTTPAGMTAMPTTPAAMTAQGAIVGTFQYMAPEQIEGRDADARTDLFALGCVMYEMLSGRKAFEGKSHASLIGAIMHAEPPSLTTVSPLMSPALDRIVRKCLAKDPEARWQSARDFVDELRWIADSTGRAPASSVSKPRRARAVLPWGIAAVTTIAAVGTGALAVRRSPPEGAASVIRFVIPMADGWALGRAPAPLAISPDGRHIAFQAVMVNGTSQIWLRSLDSAESHAVQGTEGGDMPFWSSDSQWIGYYLRSSQQLRKAPLVGDQTQLIGEAANPLGATWGPDGSIVYGTTRGLRRVPAGGGTSVALTTVQSREGSSHDRPWFLRDGRHFLFNAFAIGLMLGSLDVPAYRETVLGGVGIGVYSVVDDDVLFQRGQTIMLQHLNPRALTAAGEPTPLMSGVAMFYATPSVLVFQPSRVGGTDELRWFDRGGKAQSVLGERGDYSNVELSPDTSHVAVATRDPRANIRNIWIYDSARGIPQRFTFGAGDERTAIWSPDGKTILYNRRLYRAGGSSSIGIDFYTKAADGSGDESPLLVDGISKDPLSWAPDGQHLLYRASGEGTQNDLYVLPMSGDRKPTPFSVTPFDEQDGRISPDGRWVAYSTDETGQMEVYVSRFPSGGGKARVSVAGGTHPRWRRDGKELFYVSNDSLMMAANVTPASDAVRVDGTRALFSVHTPFQPGYVYDVTPDGQRFLVITDVGVQPPLTVVTNWRAGK
jgi:Tol biopolymer transport system component